MNEKVKARIRKYLIYTETHNITSIDVQGEVATRSTHIPPVVIAKTWMLINMQGPQLYVVKALADIGYKPHLQELKDIRLHSEK